MCIKGYKYYACARTMRSHTWKTQKETQKEDGVPDHTGPPRPPRALSAERSTRALTSSGCRCLPLITLQPLQRRTAMGSKHEKARIRFYFFTVTRSRPGSTYRLREAGVRSHRAVASYSRVMFKMHMIHIYRVEERQHGTG